MYVQSLACTAMACLFEEKYDTAYSTPSYTNPALLPTLRCIDARCSGQLSPYTSPTTEPHFPYTHQLQTSGTMHKAPRPPELSAPKTTPRRRCRTRHLHSPPGTGFDIDNNRTTCGRHFVTGRAHLLAFLSLLRRWAAAPAGLGARRGCGGRIRGGTHPAAEGCRTGRRDYCRRRRRTAACGSIFCVVQV